MLVPNDLWKLQSVIYRKDSTKAEMQSGTASFFSMPKPNNVRGTAIEKLTTDYR